MQKKAGSVLLNTETVHIFFCKPLFDSIITVSKTDAIVKKSSQSKLPCCKNVYLSSVCLSRPLLNIVVASTKLLYFPCP